MNQSEHPWKILGTAQENIVWPSEQKNFDSSTTSYKNRVYSYQKAQSFPSLIPLTSKVSNFSN